MYVLECLDETGRTRLLADMPASEAELARQALEFQPDSAGRIMQRDYVAIPSYWTIGQVIDHLRESPDVPDEFYALFVVGARHTPVGTIPLHRAMRTRRNVRVADIMTRDPEGGAGERRPGGCRVPLRPVRAHVGTGRRCAEPADRAW